MVICFHQFPWRVDVWKLGIGMGKGMEVDYNFMWKKSN